MRWEKMKLSSKKVSILNATWIGPRSVVLGLAEEVDGEILLLAEKEWWVASPEERPELLDEETHIPTGEIRSRGSYCTVASDKYEPA